MGKHNRTLLINFIFITVISFLSIFLGLKFSAANAFSVQNSMLLLCFCALIGLISDAFYQLKMKAAWIIFDIGVGVGLIAMFYTLFSRSNGWQDLAALASLFVWIVIGLSAGIIIQLLLLLHHKAKNKK